MVLSTITQIAIPSIVAASWAGVWLARERTNRRKTESLIQLGDRLSRRGQQMDVVVELAKALKDDPPQGSGLSRLFGVASSDVLGGVPPLGPTGQAPAEQRGRGRDV
ncbi:hypothetical protein [Pseudofrankia sp. BMG5.37]|uniref:hypothetical protein n=1 Tax=Pseudofrankia sp. BMG5.37 TaxID=3050035 RepID=UPI0028945C96|nr:hypothetical protein [Pseudofrankia sp. BMG5.37]MDT3445277.1 hypothetical protein [Pseudofrankia sp. BMG5.37]